MRKILASILLVLGIAGLVLGRLGETTWAPESEYVASTTLTDTGPVVAIDPGVLYVGGTQGQLHVDGEGDVSVIVAPPEDAAAYLDSVAYTRVTGASSWTELTTEKVTPDDPAEVPGMAGSDLWPAVEKLPEDGNLDIGTLYAEESGQNAQPYRTILLVSDGKTQPASELSITWPSGSQNAWVPYAYALGAVFAIVGLVLLLLALTVRSGRDERDDELAGESEWDDIEPADDSNDLDSATEEDAR